MRVLAIDHGTKRVGLAISDPTGKIVLPAGVIEPRSEQDLLEKLERIVEDRSVEEVIIGLPKNMNDTLGPRAKEVLAFAERLREVLSVPVRTWDERLTTVEAEERLRDTPLSRKRKRTHVNAVSAQILLESYLEASRASKDAPPENAP